MSLYRNWDGHYGHPRPLPLLAPPPAPRRLPFSTFLPSFQFLLLFSSQHQVPGPKVSSPVFFCSPVPSPALPPPSLLPPPPSPRRGTDHLTHPPHPPPRPGIHSQHFAIFSDPRSWLELSVLVPVSDIFGFSFTGRASSATVPVTYLVCARGRARGLATTSGFRIFQAGSTKHHQLSTEHHCCRGFTRCQLNIDSTWSSPSCLRASTQSDSLAVARDSILRS